MCNIVRMYSHNLADRTLVDNVDKVRTKIYTIYYWLTRVTSFVSLKRKLLLLFFSQFFIYFLPSKLDLFQDPWNGDFREFGSAIQKFK